MIKYDPPLRQLFQDIDRSKVRVWALTNAYRTVSLPLINILNLPSGRYNRLTMPHDDYLRIARPASTADFGSG